jgi:hypothetical protein
MLQHKYLLHNFCLSCCSVFLTVSQEEERCKAESQDAESVGEEDERRGCTSGKNKKWRIEEHMAECREERKSGKGRAQS